MTDDDRRRLMSDGRNAFNRGEFYEAHEFWEEVWNEIDDPDRTWVQGLIQIATGLHKLSRDQRAVARTLLEKALRKLGDAPAALDGFDVAQLRADATQVMAKLDGGVPVSARDVLFRKSV